MTDLTNAEIVAACMSAVSDRDPRIVAALDLIETAFHELDRTGDFENIPPVALWEVYQALLHTQPKEYWCSTNDSFEDLAFIAQLGADNYNPYWRIIEASILFIDETYKNHYLTCFSSLALGALEEIERILSQPLTVSQPATSRLAQP
jgi:hypothetical protein